MLGFNNPVKIIEIFDNLGPTREPVATGCRDYTYV